MIVGSFRFGFVVWAGSVGSTTGVGSVMVGSQYITLSLNNRFAGSVAGLFGSLRPAALTLKAKRLLAQVPGPRAWIMKLVPIAAVAWLAVAEATRAIKQRLPPFWKN